MIKLKVNNNRNDIFSDNSNVIEKLEKREHRAFLKGKSDQDLLRIGACDGVMKTMFLGNTGEKTNEALGIGIVGGNVIASCMKMVLDAIEDDEFNIDNDNIYASLNVVVKAMYRQSGRHFSFSEADENAERAVIELFENKRGIQLAKSKLTIAKRKDRQLYEVDNIFFVKKTDGKKVYQAGDAAERFMQKRSLVSLVNDRHYIISFEQRDCSENIIDIANNDGFAGKLPLGYFAKGLAAISHRRKFDVTNVDGKVAIEDITNYEWSQHKIETPEGFVVDKMKEAFEKNKIISKLLTVDTVPLDIKLDRHQIDNLDEKDIKDVINTIQLVKHFYMLYANLDYSGEAQTKDERTQIIQTLNDNRKYVETAALHIIGYGKSTQELAELLVGSTMFMESEDGKLIELKDKYRRNLPAFCDDIILSIDYKYKISSFKCFATKKKLKSINRTYALVVRGIDIVNNVQTDSTESGVAYIEDGKYYIQRKVKHSELSDKFNYIVRIPFNADEKEILKTFNGIGKDVAERKENIKNLIGRYNSLSPVKVNDTLTFGGKKATVVEVKHIAPVAQVIKIEFN